MLTYSIYAESNIGGRSENQDQYAYKETAAGLLIVVCDGVGGSNGGRIAAEKAVTIIINEFVSATAPGAVNSITNGIKKANAAIYKEGQSNAALKNMATTVAALLLQKGKAAFFHAGDSRVYQLREQSILHRTDDHSRVGEMVKRGILTAEQARLSDESNIILKALGIVPEVEIEVVENLDYEKTDRFFVCTDGIWGTMPESELITTLTEKKAPEAIIKSMISQINTQNFEKGGGHDNMTAVLVEAGSRKSGIGLRMAVMLNYIFGLLLLVSIGYILFLRSQPANPVKKEQQKQADSVNPGEKKQDTLNIVPPKKVPKEKPEKKKPE